MADTLLYLRPDVQLEPLFDSWYAWANLVAPATAARYLTERHLKIMDSFISAPQFHVQAMKDSTMMGGPFIDLGAEHVGAIRTLRDRLKKERHQLIALSNALGELSNTLAEKASGGSLSSLYKDVPDLLKGYVELVYNIDNKPSFRLIESLLYKSRFYDQSTQALRFSITEGDHRTFILNTPRLENEKSVYWQVPFDDTRIDTLFRTQTEPQTWSAIASLVQVDEDKQKLLRSFFTEVAPTTSTRPPQDIFRWRYFGHACVLIEAKGTTLLMDPCISYDYETDIPRYTYKDLPPLIDFVLITHNHQDHVLLETLLRLRYRVKNIVIPKSRPGTFHDPSLKLILQAIGYKNVIELDEMQAIEFDGGSIMGLPFLGEHGDLDIQSKIAHLVKVGGQSILFAADSCGIEPRLYEHIQREVGPIDTLFLGMESEGAPLSWVYGPLLPRPLARNLDQARRLNGSNFEQGMKIVETLQCKKVFVYAMGQEPWLTHVMGLKYTAESPAIVQSNALLDACKERSIYAERLYFQREFVLS